MPPSSKKRRNRFLRSKQQPSLFFLVEELITEILSWLPAESLTRFKCVSKSWNSLISDPSFIQLHFHRSSILPHRRHLILLRSSSSGEKTTFAASFASFRTLTHFLQNPKPSSSDQRLHRLNGRYIILGSCNGLVCLLDKEPCKRDFYYFHFLFWNPATRLVSQILPAFSRYHANYNGCYKLGFGYDKLSDTYKLVVVRFDFFAVKDSDRTQVKVHTFGSGSGSGHCWREIQRFPEFPCIRQDEGIFLSGTLNWPAVRNSAIFPHNDISWYDVAVDKCLIVSLDLGNETYKQFSMPPFGRDEMPDSFAVFNPVMEVFLDCLCLSYDCNGTRFIMWQMKEFGVEKSWTRFVSVSYEHLQIVRPTRMVPLSISENGDVLILRNSYNEIILYNRRDNGVQHAPRIRDRSLEIYVKGYAQSLISPC